LLEELLEIQRQLYNAALEERRGAWKWDVRRTHERVRLVRRDHAHQLSARLVAGYDLIAIEDLHVKAMTRSARGTRKAPGVNGAAKAGLNRSILDAGWGQLVRMLAYKAESQLVGVGFGHLIAVRCRGRRCRRWPGRGDGAVAGRSRSVKPRLSAAH
jgi:transposase